MLKKIIFIFAVAFLVFFSLDTGFAFVTETVTTDNTDNAGAPSITVDGTYAYAAWQERTGDGLTHIYYKRKLLSAAWSSVTKELVSSEQSGASARNPKIAIDSAYVYVVWEDDNDYNGLGLGSNSKIAYKRKLLAGTWPAATEVISTESSNAANNPQIAIDATYAYVTWDRVATDTHRDIYYKRKGLGDTWPTGAETVSGDRVTNHEDAYRPVIAVDTNNVYIAYYLSSDISGGANILYKKKAFASSWPVAAEIVSAGTASGQWADAPTVALVVANNTVHIAWRDNTDYGNGAFFHIVYRSMLVSSNWLSASATNTVSTESDGAGLTPSIAADATNVYVVWSDSSNFNGAGSKSHIFFKKKKVADTAWGTDTINISDESTSDATLPAITVNNGTFYMVWQDNSELGYGHTFSHVEYRALTSNPPVVAVTYPNGGESLSGTVTITATASDTDSVIDSVKFYYTADNGSTSTLIGTDTSAPYTFSWDSTKIIRSGNYKIKAVVTSADGGQATDLSDGVFYINKYADDTTFNFYSFVTDASASCYKGSSAFKPLNSEANSGTHVTNTSALQNPDEVYEAASDTIANYTYMKFNFKVADAVTNIKYFRVYWKGLASTPNSGVNLYIWNKTLASFDKIDGYNYDISNVGVHEINHKMDLTSVTISDYIKADGTVQVLVETTGNGSGIVSAPIGISTDYVRLEVSTDVTPPAATTNLQASTGTRRGTINLTWTAAGDDGNLRMATDYLIRYSTAAFGGAEFDATYVTAVSSTTAPVPQEAGNTETFTVTGLQGGVTYYFRLKTEDEVPNTSPVDTMSPQASAIAKGNTLPVVTVTNLTAKQTESVTINYALFDFDADTCSISVAYSVDGGTTFKAATKGTGGNGITGLTTSAAGAVSYSFVWDSLTDVGKSFSTLVQIRIIANDGTGAGTAAITSSFTLDNVEGLDTISNDYTYPNPFTPARGNLTIRYTLNEDKEVTISIYNISGELVKETTYDTGATGGTKGVNRILWDGKNGNNESVASGIYLAHIKADGFNKTEKIALIK